MELWYLFFAYFLMLLYICIMFHENISKAFIAIEGLLFPYSGFSKGHNSVKKMLIELWSLISAYCLIMLYICTKFHENI